MMNPHQALQRHREHSAYPMVWAQKRAGMTHCDKREGTTPHLTETSAPGTETNEGIIAFVS